MGLAEGHPGAQQVPGLPGRVAVNQSAPLRSPEANVKALAASCSTLQLPVWDVAANEQCHLSPAASLNKNADRACQLGSPCSAAEA